MASIYAKRARRRAEKYLTLITNQPRLLHAAEKAAIRYHEIASDPTTPTPHAVSCGIRATALWLLIAEVMERVEERKRKQAERN